MATPEDDMAIGGDLPDTAAAELALGLLDGAARTAALRRVATEPQFAAEVERWQGWLAALFAYGAEADVPAGMASRIEASLDARDGRAANDNDSRWRPLALTASVAACVLLAVTTVLTLRPAPAPVRVPVAVAGPAPLLAAIVPTTKGAAIAAAYDPTSGTVRIAGGVAVPAGRSAEVWAIRGTDAPRSLGLLPANGTARLAVQPALRPALAAETVLAISIEPVGGSPTGLPTGPVVAAGKLSG